jgi:hypothetical protein
MNSQQRAILLIGFVLGPFLFLFGFIGAGMGQAQYREARGAKAQPQRIRLQDLIEKGPADNTNVQITEFTFGDGYAVETVNNSWRTVWVPVFPNGSNPGVGNLGAPAKKLPPFRAVVQTRVPKNPSELETYCRQNVVQGLVISESFPLGGTIAQKLLEEYPDTDLPHCVVIEAEQAPYPRRQIVSLLIGGMSGMVVGSGLIITAFILKRRWRTA